MSRRTRLMLAGSTWRAAAPPEGAGACWLGWAHAASSGTTIAAAQNRMLTDGPNHLTRNVFDFGDRAATQREIVQIGHVDDRGDHSDVVALPKCSVVVHEPAHRHVVGEHAAGELLDSGDPCSNGEGGDQKGSDPAALVGVRDSERDLGHLRMVVVAHEACVGPRIAVTISHHPDEVVDVI